MEDQSCDHLAEWGDRVGCCIQMMIDCMIERWQLVTESQNIKIFHLFRGQLELSCQFPVKFMTVNTKYASRWTEFVGIVVFI